MRNSPATDECGKQSRSFTVVIKVAESVDNVSGVAKKWQREKSRRCWTELRGRSVTFIIVRNQNTKKWPRRSFNLVAIDHQTYY